MGSPYVIGIDYGTDSVRTVLIDSETGSEAASDVFYYPRWAEGKYCDPSRNQFRQHPQDYLDGLKQTVRNTLARGPGGCARQVAALSIDTTGSTPVAVDRDGTVLSLRPEFADNPNAMFILWKDHTAVAVLEEIAKMALLTERINPKVPQLKKTLIDKHYQRKHGVGAYYGQESE
jgi:L-ribulokinase